MCYGISGEALIAVVILVAGVAHGHPLATAEIKDSPRCLLGFPGFIQNVAALHSLGGVHTMARTPAFILTSQFVNKPHLLCEGGATDT